MKSREINYTYKEIKYSNTDDKSLLKYIALGFFDGIHRGHQALLKWCVEESKIAGAISTAVLFDEHPGKVINKINNYSLLSTLTEKIDKIREIGIQQIIVFNFDEYFSKIIAEDFLIEILLKKFNMGAVFAGYDYRFGFQKKGDIALIKQLGEFYNFKSFVMNPKTIKNGQKISTTAIKEYLKKGDIIKANKFLGYPYQIVGNVLHGDKRGNSVLSFPTANLEIEAGKLLPKNGVYLGFTYYKGQKYNSLINIGFKPTFNNENDKISVEVYIFDFAENIYNKRINISFIRRIRDEKRFTDHRDLVLQIKNDKIVADKYFKEHKISTE
ncbi:MAG TPA: bifunctional riboflavin kinase/FMN adenylyltransferase [Candidatus Atribacteria bacterium]|jgi:riboflavin kinase/FMN adenylyltransferase|nr:bifunctional riboflavin kinase/FMN adenylyltransferase [Candidatus Atribacteria bacterium]